MLEKELVIDKSVLKFQANDDYNYYCITYTNESGLFYAVDDDGNEREFTTSQIKKYTNFFKVCEVLKLLRHYENGDVYTDDGLNFESEYSFNNMMTESQKEDFYKVKFIIKE